MNEMPLRLAICCSNHLFSEGLKKLLSDDASIDVIGMSRSTADMTDSLRKIIELKPDLVIADFDSNIKIFLGSFGDLLQDKTLKILLIGDSTFRFVADKHLKDLISKGVVGILPPGADSDLLKKALKAVSAGELWLERHTLMKLIYAMKRAESTASLAKREKEIMSHICQGYKNKEIAQKLDISEQTVKSHCNRIYKKLGVSDRLQLALYSHKILSV